MKVLVLLLFIAFAGTACVSPEGTVTVNYPTEFERTTIFGSSKKFTIRAGTYTAKLKMNFKKKVVLKLNGVKFGIRFDIPRTVDNNGTTVFMREDIGQPYNIKFIISTELSEGQEHRTTESCTVAKKIHVCEMHGDKRVCKIVSKSFNDLLSSNL